MPFLIDESFLPATLTVSAMDDAEFANFCALYPDLRFEVTAEGELIVMAPTFSLTGLRSAQIGGQLYAWAEQDGRGVVADSSTGFVLPNGARRSPDAAWTLRSRLARLSEKSLQGFWHLCPDFVIELRSSTDRITPLRAKMREWMSNGAELAWLIDPEAKSVEIYRPGGDSELMKELQLIAGEGPVSGFELNLKSVWQPLGSGEERL